MESGMTVECGVEGGMTVECGVEGGMTVECGVEGDSMLYKTQTHCLRCVCTRAGIAASSCSKP